MKMVEPAVTVPSSGLQLKLLQAIKSKGVVQELKCNLRQKLIAELYFAQSQQREIKSNNDYSNFDKIAYSLCLEYLQMNNFSFSLSVFVPETGMQSGSVFSRIELIDSLKLKELCNNNEHKLLILSDPSTS
uniref:LisH domain-containing protein n=1 Tax=Mesocestoides corti TaxID=53468 RepID=A0A5K3F2W5_MESCO